MCEEIAVVKNLSEDKNMKRLGSVVYYCETISACNLTTMMSIIVL